MGRSKTPPDHLTLCSIAAHKEGLSYGKYMAKHNYSPPCLNGLLNEIMRQPQKKAKPEYLKNMEADFIPWQPPKKQCIWCGEQFIPKRMDQKYCGANCQYEAIKKRQRDKALQGKAQRYCTVCGAPLPLALSPRRLTCSKACSEEHKKAYFKAKNKREYQKRRQKAMEKGD